MSTFIDSLLDWIAAVVASILALIPAPAPAPVESVAPVPAVETFDLVVSDDSDWIVVGEIRDRRGDRIGEFVGSGDPDEIGADDDADPDVSLLP